MNGIELRTGNRKEIESSLIALKAGLSYICLEFVKGEQLIKGEKEVAKGLDRLLSELPNSRNDREKKLQEVIVCQTLLDATRAQIAYNKEKGFPDLMRKQKELTDSFLPLIHPSDYESLDYIIYLFITGRCETMKEALQLLDEEKRNNRLMKTIESASEYISKNMDDVLGRLESKIETLGSKMEAQAYKSREAMRTSSYNVAQQLETFRKGFGIYG